jgi:antitoxin VapB
MDSAKLFYNGRSQAVRLPRKYRFDTEEVYIKKLVMPLC